jgi:phosphoenolpyruvate synthase/pyruvate phosphate dikinase
MFGNVVMEIEHKKFEEVLDQIKKVFVFFFFFYHSILSQKHNAKLDTDLTAEQLDEVAVAYLALVKKEKGDFPTDPKIQLRMAIDAVFSSWDNPRAVYYRKINGIKGLIGTAVNVQMMVFGNTGDTSGFVIFLIIIFFFFFQELVLDLLVTLQLERIFRMVNTFSTLKEKMLLLVLEHLIPLV